MFNLKQNKMKKVTLHLMMLAVFMFGTNVFAQTKDDEILISDSFEEYTVGNKIAEEAVAAGHDYWTTWSGTLGGSEDGVVSDAFASEGTKSGYLTYGVDQVLLLGGYESGTYDIEFDILVPNGKNGYFNILHDFNGAGSTWAMQCYLHMTNDGQNSTPDPGHGTVHAGGNAVADVPCVYDEWMHFRLHVDTDNDEASYYYTAPGGQEQLLHTWQWSLDSFGNNVVGRKLDAIDFYPPENASTSEYYVDNIILTRIGGESAASLSFTPTEIDVEIEEDATTSVEITIENSGNSIGDWTAWVDFGEGSGGTTQHMVNYDVEPSGNSSSLGFTGDNAILVEVGAMYPASVYGGDVMGTQITQAKYYLGPVPPNENGLQPGTPLVFRIYGQGLHGQPGDILAEKTVAAADIVDGWNEVTFDTPVNLTGYNVWATCEFTQAVEGHPMYLDGEAVIPYADMYRTNGGGTFMSLNENATDNYGNFHIGITCKGNPVVGTWASLSKPEGSMAAGATDNVSVNVNATNLNDGDEYDANIKFVTNDPEHPEVMIPLHLKVGDESITEMGNTSLRIYPNPTKTNVTIEGENINAIAIYNVSGKLIDIVKASGIHTIIDMSQYGSGIYFFNMVDNNNKTSVQRVVVQ